jgi:hypothetical protein
MIQGWTPTPPIALTPAGRAGLERELRLLRGDRLPTLTAQLVAVREDGGTRTAGCAPCWTSTPGWSCAR